MGPGLAGSARCPSSRLRGITDTAGHTAVSDFDQNLELAMTNLAKLILSWTKLRS